MDKNSLTAETAEDMLKVLPGKAYDAALDLHDFGKSIGCKIEAKKGAKNYKIVYSKKKPSRTLFTIECDDKKWKVKANLFNISGYKSVAEGCSNAIKNSIKKTKECTHCNTRCVNHPSYELDGRTYLPCYGCGHFFKDMIDSDWKDLKMLIKYEAET